MKKNIVILGGGTAGWITASILSKGLNLEEYNITLIESPDIPTVGVGEATIPPIVQLTRFLEIDEADMLTKISGTFKYGIHFEGWHDKNQSYMHAFGYLGKTHKNFSFPQLWLKYKAELELTNLNAPYKLNDFSPTAIAAYKGLFNHPQILPKGTNSTLYFPLTNLHYAYQFDAGLLANYLKEYAIKAGINFIPATVNKVTQDPQGNIQSLTLSNNALISGDYFIDCSGAKGLLSKQTLKSEFVSWQEYLPCDRAIAVQTKNDDAPIPPYTKSIAMNAGWRWQIPLQHRTGNGYVFASEFCQQQNAEDEFIQALGTAEKITDLRTIHFSTGCLKNPWNKNCIALGLASGFLEPLESTSIHMTHKYAIELMNAFRFGENMEEEATKFNNDFFADSTMIRDFLVLHYNTTKREDTQFWTHCKNMKIPASLQNKLAEFEQTGFITLPKNSLFAFESWFQVLMGQEYLSSYQQFHDESFDHESANFFLANIQKAIAAETSRLKSHDEYLKIYTGFQRLSKTPLNSGVF